jgi:hypothetical protein
MPTTVTVPAFGTVNVCPIIHAGLGPKGTWAPSTISPEAVAHRP